jgi:hypothetical protein
MVCEVESGAVLRSDNDLEKSNTRFSMTIEQ